LASPNALEYPGAPVEEHRASEVRRARSCVPALAAVVVALLMRAPIADIPFERDEGDYAYIAWRWLEQELPYRDVFDQKPPAIFAVYALLHETLGTTPEAIHWGAQLWLCAAQLALFALACAWFGRGVATAAALLFALLTSSPGVLGNAANVEGFALLPVVAGVALARRGAALQSRPAAALAGAAGSAALFFKPVTLPLVIFSLLLLVFSSASPARIRLGLASAFAAGGAAFALPPLLWLADAGVFAPFYEATVRFNLSYAAAVPLRNYPMYFLIGIQPSLATLAPVYAAAALSPLAAYRSARRGGVRGWLWGWLGAALLAVAAGGYFRQHYFLYAAPPIAVLAAVGCADLLRAGRFGSLLRSAGPSLAALGMIGWALAAAPWYYLPGSGEAKARALYGENLFADAPALAAFLAERSDPGERLFVFGSEPELHVYARRPNVGRYVLAYHYTMGAPEDARMRQREVLEALRAEPPRLVVAVLHPFSLLESPNTPRELHHGLAALLRERYRPCAQLRLRPRADGPARIETSEAELVRWRDAVAIERVERPGIVVVYERVDP
jgi:hypothetical protein